MQISSVLGYMGSTLTKTHFVFYPIIYFSHWAPKPKHILFSTPLFIFLIEPLSVGIRLKLLHSLSVSFVSHSLLWSLIKQQSHNCAKEFPLFWVCRWSGTTDFLVYGKMLYGRNKCFTQLSLLLFWIELIYQQIRATKEVLIEYDRIWNFCLLRLIGKNIFLATNAKRKCIQFNVFNCF